MKTKKFVGILPRSEIGCSMSISDTQNKVTIHTPGNYSLVITGPTVVIDEVIYKSLEERVEIYERALEWYKHLGPDMESGIALWDGGEKAREALKSGRGE